MKICDNTRCCEFLPPTRGARRFTIFATGRKAGEGVKPEQIRRPADAFIGFAACGITVKIKTAISLLLKHSGTKKGIGCFRRCKSVLNFCCAVSRKDTVDFIVQSK